ncbi:uncharacterized protein LOC143548359 [Bidens hawaiensis]|uniref:uncharacterized protein LOC143548359 n=1 Tax=Bidens hawaiensis TaxID=980011 RepID=UPI00404A74FF
MYVSHEITKVEELLKTKDLKGISFDLLVSGKMVNACVRSTLEKVHIFHLGKTLPDSKWKDNYTANKKVPHIKIKDGERGYLSVGKFSVLFIYVTFLFICLIFCLDLIVIRCFLCVWSVIEILFVVKIL